MKSDCLKLKIPIIFVAVGSKSDHFGGSYKQRKNPKTLGLECSSNFNEDQRVLDKYIFNFVLRLI